MKRFLPLLALPLLAAISGCARHGNYLLNPSIRDLRRLPMPPARIKVEEIIEHHTRDKDVAEVAVYFHSLRTGYWFGINEKNNFIPASLLKVYLLMRVMVEEEDAPGTLGQHLELRRDPSSVNPEVGPEESIIVGKQYTVDTLVRHMMLHSNNDAAYTLNYSFGDRKLAQIYSDFGFDYNSASEENLSLKQYLMVFLTLYNGTYLGPKMSQRALEYLVEAKFDEGLAAGLPKGMTLANKFGERGFDTPEGRLQQLHDCGIVYHREYPYILGVMTRGSDIKKLEKIIQEISAAIYQEVESRSIEARK